MKALIKKQAGEGLSLGEVPKPDKISGHEVLIKIEKTAICGTDMHIYEWNNWAANTIPTPMHIGHEFFGRVVEVGADVQHLSRGDRVSGEGHITCGRCRNCLRGKRFLCPNTKGIGVNIPGAFAEYLVMPAQNVFALPDRINDDIAAIMDPYGNAVHTALSFNCSGEDVLITGSGPIGIMAALIVQHLGARHVVLTDVNEHRLALAKNLGVKHCLNVSNDSIQAKMKHLGMLEGFDICLEMSGNAEALNQAIKALINGGKIAQLGIFNDRVNIDMNSMVFKGIFMKGIYGREIFETWYKMVTLIDSGLDISGIITHHFAVENYLEAFQAMQSGTTGKVILTW